MDGMIMNQAWLKTRKRTFELLEVAKPGDKASKATDIFLVVLILVNVLAMVFGTVEAVRNAIGIYLDWFEFFSVKIFTLEYILRIWTVVEKSKKTSLIKYRIRYIFSFMALVDLFAILPSILPIIFPMDLRFLRLFRLFRMARLLKMGRYSKAVQTFSQVLKGKKEELVVAVIAVLFLLLISSTLMFYFENEAQPQAFKSIPDAMWWAAAALTTVGYGDVTPITTLGKMLGIVSAILGIGLFALPAGILASGFSEALTFNKTKDNLCPTCGQKRQSTDNHL
jgi:voltage-gated potassium channel